MHKIFILLSLAAFISCGNQEGTGKYYTKAQWQKFRKDYDMGRLKDRPLEAKTSYFTDLDDSSLSANGTPGGYELYKFNANGDLSFWHSQKSDSEWVTAEMKYDENGLQSNYYTQRDTLKTFADAGKVISRKLDSHSFLLHSFFNIGPPFMLVSFYENGNKVVKKYLPDSSNFENAVKTVTAYYQDSLVKEIETTTKEGWKQVDKYFYSSNHFLDSITKFILNGSGQRETFTYNNYGDPLTYVLQRVPKNDTIEYDVLRYEYDARGNWIKRLENRIKGNYAATGKNIHYSLTTQEIKYKE